ncbi:MAG: hypothetical protein K0Q68_323 [Moraxellaceae bacterium]|jgi:hyperosmotically inducible protein|nr:hypothetical protein [Moraxellaceae bacterium]
MRIKACLAGVAGLFLTACAATPEAPGDFARADSNGDGHVSLNEWKQSGGRELAFLAADTQKKGRLDESAFYAAQRLDRTAGADAESARQAGDAQITQDIRAALGARREINGHAIRVETYQGTVQLSGSVRSDREKRAAEDTAASVRGVRQVFNSIVIQN